MRKRCLLVASEDSHSPNQGERSLRSLNEGPDTQVAEDGQRLLQPLQGRFPIPLVALIQTALV
ncbi:MAG: hypothetical protein ACR2JC_03065 [Chloroflexota bacterium]|nr:MAG: hypothetical protein DLM70_08285 [Chloroflexota bacterium]